jgi:hypothetical protein
MFKLIKKYIEKRNQRRKCVEAQAINDELLAKAEKITENTELRTICINNVSYIESYINVLGANINHAKGTNAAETNRKRKSMRDRITWLNSKLSEEKAMVEYYCSLLKTLQKH